MKTETVLCVEAKTVAPLLQANGITPLGDPGFNDLLRSAQAWFAPRSSVEDRREFLQLIPYVILYHAGRVAVYRRTSVGGDDRLHDRMSIGFGGHVTLLDAVLTSSGMLDVWDTLSRAAVRELAEEVKHPKVLNRRILGLLYDDQDTVGRVHLGIVELWNLTDSTVHAVEEAIGDFRFVGIEELQANLALMEGWSRTCTEYLVRVGFEPLLISPKCEPQSATGDPPQEVDSVMGCLQQHG